MSSAAVPPPDYWKSLEREMPGDQLDALRRRSDARDNEVSVTSLPPPEESALLLLERVARDGWFDRVTRWHCPACREQLDAGAAAEEVCPKCGEAFSTHGGVIAETVFVRQLAPPRVVDWVIVIHGMNTTGAWQEAFTWLLSTTWGRSVPVAVYKYGIVIPGVIMPWRREKLRDQLREKIAVLRDAAVARGHSGKPDVVAHSFGTWLLGHLLLRELERPAGERLDFGRIILAGCILRPDFDWRRLKDEGLVDDVLNHFGTADTVVPFAHATIADSGPSGRRGFDGSEVLNVRAEGYGHSDLLSEKHLDDSYGRFWKPFLTLPRSELHRIPSRGHTLRCWRPLPWPLRGTLFPPLVLLLLAACSVLLIAELGTIAQTLWQPAATAARFCAYGLGALLTATGLVGLWRQLTR